MTINRNNYESFLVDYADGTLSESLRKEVEVFLLKNADIKEEFELFGEPLVSKNVEQFSEKGHLKKIPYENTNLNSPYFQQLCVGYIENILPESERDFIEKLAKNDALMKSELEWFEKTKLIAEHHHFNEKLLLMQGAFIHEITEANFEEYCIASMEGWLELPAQINLNNYLKQNADKRTVLATFYKTRVSPDLSIVYPDKQKIKRFIIFTPVFKRYATIASSVAAAMAIGFIVYNTITLENKTQLAGNVSAIGKHAPSEVKYTETITSNKASENLILQSIKNLNNNENLMHDSKLAIASNTQTITPINIQRMEPIQVSKIDCPPCKQVFESKLVQQKNLELLSNLHEQNDNDLKTNSENSDEKFLQNPVWAVAQAGIKGFNKITGTELKLEKKKEQNKTRIAFNSKYFSFSTQVNNN